MLIELDWGDLTLLKLGLTMLAIDGKESALDQHIRELRERVSNAENQAWEESESYRHGIDLSSPL